jgi:hypothetical protein
MPACRDTASLLARRSAGGGRRRTHGGPADGVAPRQHPGRNCLVAVLCLTCPSGAHARRQRRCWVPAGGESAERRSANAARLTLASAARRLTCLSAPSAALSRSHAAGPTRSPPVTAPWRLRHTRYVELAIPRHAVRLMLTSHSSAAPLVDGAAQVQQQGGSVANGKRVLGCISIAAVAISRRSCDNTQHGTSRVAPSLSISRILSPARTATA